MSLSSKHSRSITVDGSEYRWQVRGNRDRLGVSIEDLDTGQVRVVSLFPDEFDDPDEVTPSLVRRFVEQYFVARKPYAQWKPTEKDRRRYKKMSPAEIALDVWQGILPDQRWSLEFLSDGSPLFIKIRRDGRDLPDGKGDLTLSFNKKSDLPTECYVRFKLWQRANVSDDS